MIKTIQKNMLVLGGLLVLTQASFFAPAARAAVILPENSPIYLHAATSAVPIVYGRNSQATLANIGNALNKANTAVQDVTADINPTIDQIKGYVLAEAKKAGLNTREVSSIVNCESRWDDQAYNKNYNGSIDLGLWQINSIHKDISSADKLDYKAATKWAIAKRLSDGNWSAWSCSHPRKIADAPASNSVVDLNW